MSISNPFFSIILFGIVFLTVWLLQFFFKEEANNDKNETVRGLRGLLGIGVFIHHTNVWYQFIHYEVWHAPESKLYTHFGETSVLFFFMITSYLFTSKLIHKGNSEFNWKTFFMSRIFRIFPMYLVTLLIILLIVMSQSHWQLRVSISDFLYSVGNWLFFGINEAPNINNFDSTDRIISGIQWTLPFEWLFYFSLPLLCLLIYRKVAYKYLFISLLFIGFYASIKNLVNYPTISFFGGIIAAFSVKKYDSFPFDVKRFGDYIILICLAFIGFFQTSYNFVCIFLISIIFTLIVNGCSVFGLLKLRILYFLSDICYSTYLLHGVVLFVLFYLGIGLNESKNLSELYYGGLICLATPIVVIVSFLGYRLVEKPFNDYFRNSIRRKKSAV